MAMDDPSLQANTLAGIPDTVFGPSNGQTLPEIGGGNLGKGLVGPLVQQYAVTNLLHGGPGTRRASVMTMFGQHRLDPSRVYDGVNDFALSKTLYRHAKEGKIEVSKAEQAALKRYRINSAIQEKGRHTAPHEGLSVNKGLNPAERASVAPVRSEAQEILERLPEAQRGRIMEEARNSQGKWMAGRLANKAIMGGMAFGMGFDMGPTTGMALGVAGMAAGVAAAPLAFLSGYAQYRGHRGGALGLLKTLRKGAEGPSMLQRALKGPKGIKEGLDNLGSKVVRDEGFEEIASLGGRRAALAAGAKKAIGRGMLAPRNFIIYGALMAAGAAASTITRAPVGGRNLTRFEGGQHARELLNDPQNVEARMLAMSHLQSDSMSAVQALGRESKYFLRQWSMNPDPSMYGVR